jgi:Flp pilus assembly CpaE family ATPase
MGSTSNTHDAHCAGLQIGVWAPKGGAGATSLALNLAAAALEHGVTVAYADLDPTWGEGGHWFARSGGDPVDTSPPSPPPSVASPVVTSFAALRTATSGRARPTPVTDGLAPLVHPCGLRGFIARDSDDVVAVTTGLRAGFDLVVFDMPSGVEPDVGAVDALYMVVGADLLSLRRARFALSGWFDDPDVVRPVVTTRRGAAVRVDDVDTVLGRRAVGVLVDEPMLRGWNEQGRFLYPHRRSRWAREVRALAAQAVREARRRGRVVVAPAGAVDPADAAVDGEPPAAVAFDAVAARLRRRS